MVAVKNKFPPAVVDKHIYFVNVLVGIQDKIAAWVSQHHPAWEDHLEVTVFDHRKGAFPFAAQCVSHTKGVGASLFRAEASILGYFLPFQNPGIAGIAARVEGSRFSLQGTYHKRFCR